MAQDQGKGIALASDEGRRNRSPSPDTKFQMQALVSHFEKLLDRKLEELHERIDHIEDQDKTKTNQGDSRHAPTPHRFQATEEEMEVFDGEYEDVPPRRRLYQQPRRGQRRQHEDDMLGGIKVKVPPFQGKSDPEAYLEWEMRIEQVFSCHAYSEEKKVKLASLEFTDYALIWWDQMQKERIRYGRRPINTWEDMKFAMRRRFVPSHYHRDLHNKLQRLTQGSRSVEDYYKEMQVAMIRANIEEDPEATMARFLHGLNREIADQVEMYHHVEIQDMIHQATKIEQQLKRRSSLKKPTTPFTP